MSTLDDETIKDLKSERLADLIEQIIANTAMDILSRLAGRQNHVASSICYKTDCPSRDAIPF